MSYWWIQTVNKILAEASHESRCFTALIWMVLEAQGEDPYDYV